MRLFVAAWPDETTRRRLAALELELGRTKNLRLVGPTRWHVTLRFLGEVTEERLGAARRRARRRPPRPSRGRSQCRLGPATAWFTGVRVLQLPATGSTASPRPCGRATAPLVAEPAGRRSRRSTAT